MKSLFLFMFLGIVISSYSVNYIISPASEWEFGEAQSSSYNLLVDTNVVLKNFCLNCFEKIEKRFAGNLENKCDIEYIGRYGVGASAILDALKNPLKVSNVVTDYLGRQSQRFIGRLGEVIINLQTGKIISTNPTFTSKAVKLLKQLKQ